MQLNGSLMERFGRVFVSFLAVTCLVGAQLPQDRSVSSATSTQSWTLALRDPAPAAREQAAYALSRIGPAAKDAVPELVLLLGVEKIETVRLAAVSALGWIGNEARDAVPALRKILEQERSDAVRWRAATALGQIGPGALDALTELTYVVIVDKHIGVRTGAAFALRRIGEKAVPALILGLILPDENPLNSGRDETSRSAAPEEVLAEAGKIYAPGLVQALVDLSTLSTEEVFDKWLKAVAGDRFDWLAAKLREQQGASIDSFKSNRIKDLLSRVGRDAVPAISKMLDHSDDNVKRSAVVTLTNIGPAASEAVPALLRLFERSMANLTLRQPLVEALAKIGPGRADVAQAFMSALKSTDPYVRADLVLHLNNLAERDAYWLQVLTERLSDLDPIVRYNAAGTLARIAPKANNLVSTLVDLVEREAQLRQGAINLLGSLGPVATAAVPSLCKWLKDGDYYAQSAATRALGEISQGSSLAVSALLASIREGDPRLRSSAIDALGEIGPSAKTALPELIPLIDGPDGDLRRAAAGAIKAIDSATAADLGIL
jgi:HEAT repeat protein